MEITKVTDKNLWESLLLSFSDKTFLNSWNWGEFNKTEGNSVWRFVLYENSLPISLAQVIKIKARRGIFLFVPHGPVIAKNQNQNLKIKILNVLLEELKKIAKSQNCDFIRIAPIWEKTAENEEIFKKLGFKNAPIHMHPELTWELDLTLSSEKLLLNMRKTTRYLIKKAQSNNDIKIIQSKNPEDIEKFYKLYQETARCQNFVPFSLNYIKNEFSVFSKDDQALLFLGEYKKEVLAAALIIFWQGIAFYHHGASSLKYPKIPVSYLVQWNVISEAKKRNCHTYNFWGIAPIIDESKIKTSKFENLGSSQNKNQKFKILSQKHPWYGLSLFKIGFGGQPKHYVKTKDYSLSLKYWLNFFIEAIRRKKRNF